MRLTHRALLCAATLAMIPASSLLAQEPPPGVDVDRVTLSPGETRAFTLKPGNTHQLLVATGNMAAKGVVVMHYEASATGSVLTVTSKTGNTMAYTILADPDGDGAYTPAGAVDRLPGDGSIVTSRWPTNMGKLNVGDFIGGPRPLAAP